jgi:hypothetical protein
MDMLKMVSSRSFIFRLAGASLMVTRFVGGTYGMGDQLLSCPFSHLESFSPSWVLRVVLILVCCQIVVLSTSLANQDLAKPVGTVLLAWWLKIKTCREQKFQSKNSCLCRFCMYNQLDGLAQKKIWPSQNALLDKNRVLTSKCPTHFAKWEDRNKRVVLPV